MDTMEKIFEVLASINGRLDSVDSHLDSIDDRLDSMEGRLDSMEGRLDSVEGRLDSMEGRLDSMEGRLDSMDGRLDRVETEITSIKEDYAAKEDVQETKMDMLALMEAYFDPKFNLLADQLKLMQEKQVPAEALEEAEDRLDVLEAVVKRHSAEIRRLKKAQ